MQALGRTWLRRPDLLDEAALSKADRKLLDGLPGRMLAAATRAPTRPRPAPVPPRSKTRKP